MRPPVMAEEGVSLQGAAVSGESPPDTTQQKTGKERVGHQFSRRSREREGGEIKGFHKQPTQGLVFPVIDGGKNRPSWCSRVVIILTL